MKIYHLTSVSFVGYVEFIFTDDELLHKMEIHAELSNQQQVYLLKRMPREILELDALKSDTAQIIEVKQEVNFEMFWNHYDDKINSSKKKAQWQWNKLTSADRYRAYRFISKYFSSIPTGTRKKFATTYLSDELLNN